MLSMVLTLVPAGGRLDWAVLLKTLAGTAFMLGAGWALHLRGRRA